MKLRRALGWVATGLLFVSVLACQKAEPPKPQEEATATQEASGFRMSENLTDEQILKYQGLPGVVRLGWKTQSEENNFGFNVMRSLTEDGEYTKVNQKVILGAGNSSTENAYEFLDTDVKIGDAFYYYLESIAFDGTIERFSPVMPPHKVKRLNLTAMDEMGIDYSKDPDIKEADRSAKK